MSKYIFRLLLTFWLLAFTQESLADRVTRYVPGAGTYGVSTQKYRCSRCGKILHKGDGHACTVETHNRTSMRSSGGYEASDAEADAMISSNPDLLINKSYVKSPNYVTTGDAYEDADEVDEGSSDDDDFDEDLLFGVILGIGVIILVVKNS